MRDLPPLLDVAALAQILGLSEHGVRAMLRRGELPACRVGRKWIVRRDALEAHLRRSERRRREGFGDEGAASAIASLRRLPSRRGRRADEAWTEL